MEERARSGGIVGKARERCMSAGNLDEFIRRKRNLGDVIREEELESFKRSNMTKRSPEKRKGVKDERGEEGSTDWRKELEEAVKEVMKEMRDGMREFVKIIRDEVEGMRKEGKERERKWEEDRRKMENRIEKMEEKIRELSEGREIERGREGREIKGEERDREGRLKRLERRWEGREREERRKNFLIRGLEVREGKRKEAIEEMMGVMGVKVNIREIIGLGKDEKKGRETVLVKLENEEQRREIWGKKRLLKGRKERIQEDWTWGERRMRWKLEEIAKREEREGRKVWIAYGKIRIDGEWWIWDEEEELLKDKKGNVKEGKEKKEREEKKEKKGEEI